MSTGVHGGRIAATVALALLAGACSGADGPAEPPSDGTDVAAGEAVDLDRALGVEDLDAGRTLTVRVPSGEVRVAWQPADEVEGARQQAAGLEPADGTELVVLAWDLDVSAVDVPGVSDLAALGTDAALEVALTGDDHETVMTSSSPVEGWAGLVALPDPGATAVRVLFDGVEQTVGPGADDRQVPTEAAPLYEGLAYARTSLDCRPARVGATCRVDAAWLPWTDDGGWAPVGELWPVVRVEGSVPGGRDVRARVVLDGSDPVTSVYEDVGDGRLAGLHVFAARRLASADVDVEVDAGSEQLVGSGVLVPALP